MRKNLFKNWLNKMVFGTILCLILSGGIPTSLNAKESIRMVYPKLPIISHTNSGLSKTVPYVINKKGNKAKYDKVLTKKLGVLMQSYSSGSMNNIDKYSQQYCLSKEHFIFLNDISDKWIRGIYSKNKTLRLASHTKFTMWSSSEEPAWSLVDGSIGIYEVKSRNVDKILSYIGKTNFSSFSYVYAKCFYDRKTKTTTVYLMNGRIF